MKPSVVAKSWRLDSILVLLSRELERMAERSELSAAGRKGSKGSLLYMLEIWRKNEG